MQTCICKIEVQIETHQQRQKECYRLKHYNSLGLGGLSRIEKKDPRLGSTRLMQNACPY